MNRHKYEGALIALLALIGSSATAMAQNAAEPATAPAPAAASGSLGLGLSSGTTTPPVLNADANARTNAPTDPAPAIAPSTAMELPPLPPVAEVAIQTDHERVVGGVGIGLLGVRSLHNFNIDTNGDGVRDPFTVHAPVVGFRYWLNEGVGIQAGLGLAHQSGTESNNIVGQSNVDDATSWAFVARAGMPLALFHDKHYSFLIIPEASFGYDTWRLADNKNIVGDQGVSGRAWLLDVGVRAGAEIHFGFIGMPMLSLEGTVGAQLTYRDSAVKSVNADDVEIEEGHYTLGLETAHYNDPWDLFTSSISALYYFK